MSKKRKRHGAEEVVKKLRDADAMLAAGKDLAASWPAGGPKILWQHKVGAGWSGPVVSGGKVARCRRRVSTNRSSETLATTVAVPASPLESVRAA